MYGNKSESKIYIKNFKKLISYVEAKWFLINQILCKIIRKQITQLSKLQAIFLSYSFQI